MINFEAFRKWQLEGNRTVKIEMGGSFDKENIMVFVYDYDMKLGQIVQSVEEINLEERRKAQLEQVMKELSALSKNQPVVKDSL